MNLYLNPVLYGITGRRRIDIKVGNDLVKENGGKVIGLAPCGLGFIVSTTPEVAEVCDLLPWE